jgi:hypothetical protein
VCLSDSRMALHSQPRERPESLHPGGACASKVSVQWVSQYRLQLRGSGVTLLAERLQLDDLGRSQRAAAISPASL